VANSLLLGAAILGSSSPRTPESHRPALRVRQAAERLAARSGARLSWTSDPSEAVRGADFVYTDVWTSMGQEAEADARRAVFEAYQVNERLLRSARKRSCSTACPPTAAGDHERRPRRPRSLVLDQAENRLHAQKACSRESSWRSGLSVPLGISRASPGASRVAGAGRSAPAPSAFRRKGR